MTRGAAQGAVSRLKLEPKQGTAFLSEATEVLYGGAAGGGKSYLLRASAIRWCVEVPGIQVYFFRRTLPDLRDNHLRGPTSFHFMLAPYVGNGDVKYRAVENEFEFWNGSILHLCYCDSENDVEKYRGAEIHVLVIDELTHFSEYQYRFLRSRVRVAGMALPQKYAGRLPRVEAASNPGSIGHAWVKRTFIAPKPALETWRVSAEEGGMIRQFIPARLSDNPYLTRDDPAYADRLRGLGSDHLVRAMLEGDWNLIAGQAYEKLRLDTHCLEPFVIPDQWGRYRSVDWGSTHPFSVGWWAVVPEETYVHPERGIVDADIHGAKKLRSGALVRYREWYGWNKKADEGLRLEAADVARGIVKRSESEQYGYTVGDSSMWAVDGGPSIAETFLRHGVPMRKSHKGPNSRHVGYVEVRGRIAGDQNGPMLYAFRSCHEGFWRTMPDLILDETKYGLKSESVETSQEDHVSDEVTYMCTSRPWIRPVDKDEPKQDRWMRAFDRSDAKEETWKTV